MPIYEYECRQCAKRTELLQRLGEAPLATCPECGGEVKKLVSAPAVQFKGSGWYVTDYAGKGKGPAGSKPEGGKSESKPEGAKPESSSAKESPPSSSSSGGEAKGSTSKPASSGSD